MRKSKLFLGIGVLLWAAWLSLGAYAVQNERHIRKLKAEISHYAEAEYSDEAHLRSAEETVTALGSEVEDRYIERARIAFPLTLLGLFGAFFVLVGLVYRSREHAVAAAHPKPAPPAA